MGYSGIGLLMKACNHSRWYYREKKKKKHRRVQVQCLYSCLCLCRSREATFRTTCTVQQYSWDLCTYNCVRIPNGHGRGTVEGVAHCISERPEYVVRSLMGFVADRVFGRIALTGREEP